jgi:hypothetical protein
MEVLCFTPRLVDVFVVGYRDRGGEENGVWRDVGVMC